MNFLDSELIHYLCSEIKRMTESIIMNKIYLEEYLYLRFSRSFTKRDKYACKALYHIYNPDYWIIHKKSKGKRLVIYKLKKER